MWEVVTTCVRPRVVALKRAPMAVVRCVGIQHRPRWVCASELEVSRVVPKPIDCRAKLGRGVVPQAAGAHQAANVYARKNPTKDNKHRARAVSPHKRSEDMLGKPGTHEGMQWRHVRRGLAASSVGARERREELTYGFPCHVSSTRGP